MSHIVAAPTPGALYDQRLAIILGILTLLAALAVLASCRVVPVILRKLNKDPLKSRLYKSVYNWHAYFWWIFITLAILHILTAFFHTGFPQAGDPDAAVHWWILGFAFASLVFFFLVITSCRVAIPFWNFFTGNNPLESRGYNRAYSLHGFWWWPWVLSFLVHAGIAYAHTGIWPR